MNPITTLVAIGLGTVVALAVTKVAAWANYARSQQTPMNSRNEPSPSPSSGKKCFYCKSEKSSSFKTLRCGHEIHSSCFDLYQLQREILKRPSDVCLESFCQNRTAARVVCVVCKEHGGTLDKLSCGHNTHEICLKYFQHKLSITNKDPRACPVPSCVENEIPPPESEVCGVCEGEEEEGSPYAVSCGHKFHDECLKRFRASRSLRGLPSNVCPLKSCEQTIATE